MINNLIALRKNLKKLHKRQSSLESRLALEEVTLWPISHD